ncbi:MAG: 2,3-bisphosphoglycerate-independent phosphoglycerate mutase [Flavobacteriales bacterium]|nr:2,3-bisphosphoglycerate-independent phosphoglycerate mutase [Flavobacteriales bacterium]
MKQSNKVGLIILDGWGQGAPGKQNAIDQAKTPYVDALLEKYPNASLLTDGEHVGLPSGQMGNSEVGHMNIGAGRIVYQDLLRIDRAISSGDFFKNEELNALLDDAKMSGQKVHLMGLVSHGGVHSQQAHLNALLDLCHQKNLPNVAVHAFTDGRDCDPNSGLEALLALEKKMNETGAVLASLHGRYYAMDRDLRWERIAKSYNVMVKGEGPTAESGSELLREAYKNGTTDEFIIPHVICGENGAPNALIEEGDLVICFNFRTDRCRQITRALSQEDFDDFGMKKLKLTFATMTNYDSSFKNVKVLYDKDKLKDTLGETLSAAGKKQLRMAETEKYPHVTFFFNGGREVPFEGESRLMANSPKVATYDLQPEMSAQDLVDLISPEIENEAMDFFCLNFANPDMVGHTGVFDAIVKAVEVTDNCLKQVAELAIKHNYQLIVIADHGNADMALNADGSANTAHTTNPVPIIIISDDVKTVKSGVLADVAPSVLKLMNLPQPAAMTGSSLV